VKTIYLLRHAKSSWDDPSALDHDRPLAPRGRKALPVIAGYIVRAGVRPQLVLCSSAMRAQQTYAGIASALGHPEVLVDDGLYEASSDDLLDRLRHLPDDVESVMLVGHNPAIWQLAAGLAAQGEGPAAARLEQGLPTGALVTFTFEAAWGDLGLGCACLKDLAVPK
jgi:phosphohistidine phosphatase